MQIRIGLCMLATLLFSSCGMGVGCQSPLCMEPGERNRFYCLIDFSAFTLKLEQRVAAVYLSEETMDSYYVEGMPDMLKFYQGEEEIVAIGGFDQYARKTLYAMVRTMESSGERFDRIRLMLYLPQRDRDLEHSLEALGARLSYHDIGSISCGSE